jgi:uncharacterized protein YfdQ (DUF2303 family)
MAGKSKTASVDLDVLKLDTAGFTTEAAAIAALGVQAAGKAQILVTPDARVFMILPEGVTAKEVTDPHNLIVPAPGRIKQKVELLDKDSLSEYIIRHRTDSTIIFADPFDDTFSAQIDWHGAEEANFIEHRATLKLQRSEEWKRWSGISGKLLPQMEFAQFLEENAADVLRPSGADLLEVAKDLSARRNVNWKSAIRLDNGDEAFGYAEETVAQAKSGQIDVPRMFVLQIPVYMNEPPLEVNAFLRWKLDSGALGIGIQLHRPVFIQQAVFNRIGQDIAGRTDRQVLTGRIGAGVTTAA